MANPSAKIVLEVQSRDEQGKNACRRLRAAGQIPGNVYGLDRPPFMVAVNPKRIDELLRLDRGVNTIFSLTLAGEERTREAMIKELQRDPLSGYPIHVDFVRVDVNKPVQVHVPIRLVGTATGVKNELGIMDFVHRVVEVECLPVDIPEHLDVDVTELHINQHVSLSDLQVPEGLRVLEDLEQIVAVVVAPKVEEEPVAEEAEVTEEGEPEVLKKGKEAEGAEEAADKATEE